jgi:DNA repair protein RadC
VFSKYSQTACRERQERLFIMGKNQKMKDLPRETRPYERCFSCGPAALSDEELLAVIIRTDVNGMTSVELSNRILQLAGPEGIAGLGNLTVQELVKIKGVGQVKAVQILCIAELSGRIAKRRKADRLNFNSPQAVADYYMEEMRHKDKEELKVLMLDGKSALITETTISVGTVNFAVASPREIFLEALKYQAVGIIIMHNHPSGDPTPSRNDIISTRKIREAGEIIGISLIDHIVIGDNKYTSFCEKKLL